ncbi:MAG: hypothetical protein WA373_16685 [Burkholderiales bacterium]
MKTKQQMSAALLARKILFFALLADLLLMLSPSAWAVPSYARRYGMECSGCHTMWGALTGPGVQFRLSGYRAIGGKDLTPISEDIEIAKGATIPSTLPLSFVTGVGYDSRTEKREASNGTSNTSNGSSIALEDASIFMTSPLGQHLSAFVEFPMYETKAWEFTPTGKFEANNTASNRQIQFAAENPTFEVAKFFWNNPLGDTTPRDSFNFLFGITHLPLGYASGKVRLSVNQYLIYERRALDLISPNRPSDVLGGADEYLFKLGEPQILAEAMGMLMFGKPVTDVSKRDTFWAEYHLGFTNGSNGKADNNTKKDLYGRWVMRWYLQSLGFFAYHSADQYDDTQRTNASIAGNPMGIMSGRQDANSSNRRGIDFTLSLVPMGVPVWLENQYMSNNETNPTGFGREFKWKGGFHQLNWQISKTAIAYARYDYVKGDTFDDTMVTMNGVTGITASTPKEHDFVLGAQHLIEQNVKLVAEFRDHKFEDTATPTAAKLSDTGFTLRIMLGF